MRTLRCAPMDPSGTRGGGTGEGWKQHRDMVPCPGWGSATSSPSCPSPVAPQIAGKIRKAFFNQGVQQLPQLSSPQNLTHTPKRVPCVRREQIHGRLGPCGNAESFKQVTKKLNVPKKYCLGKHS